MSSGRIYLGYVFLNSETTIDGIKASVDSLCRQVNERLLGRWGQYLPEYENTLQYGCYPATIRIYIRGDHPISTETIAWCQSAIDRCQRWAIV